MVAAVGMQVMDHLLCESNIIRLGRINGLYGVKGWVKVFSETQPRDNILTYTPWLIRQAHAEWHSVVVTAGRQQGKGIIAHLQGYHDPDAARKLMGAEIAIHRDQLAPLADNEYYWADLQGLTVETKDGTPLGTVDYIFDTGANDVLVVTGERERLIPFIQGQTILEVDLPGRMIRVEWEPEF